MQFVISLTAPIDLPSAISHCSKCSITSLAAFRGYSCTRIHRPVHRRGTTARLPPPGGSPPRGGGPHVPRPGQAAGGRAGGQNRVVGPRSWQSQQRSRNRPVRIPTVRRNRDPARHLESDLGAGEELFDYALREVGPVGPRRRRVARSRQRRVPADQRLNRAIVRRVEIRTLVRRVQFDEVFSVESGAHLAGGCVHRNDAHLSPPTPRTGLVRMRILLVRDRVWNHAAASMLPFAPRSRSRECRLPPRCLLRA